MEWDAVKPLVQKVLDAQRETMNGHPGGMARSIRVAGAGNSPAGDQAKPDRPHLAEMNDQTGPEQAALQQAIDDHAPAAQIRGLLDKSKASQKAKQARLESAQADLKAVLSTRQEALAYQSGLVN